MFWKRKTELKPQSREEELSFLQSKNSFMQKKLNIERSLVKEKVKGKKMKRELFKHTTAGKALNLMGRMAESAKENFKPPRKKGGGGFGVMSAKEMWK